LVFGLCFLGNKEMAYTNGGRMPEIKDEELPEYRQVE